MERFVRKQVVVLPFPFSDFSNAKRRPALVLAPTSRNDLILCQITRTTTSYEANIPLVEEDFVAGKLRCDSFIRPDAIFTADPNIISYAVGEISSTKFDEVLSLLIRILRG